MAEFSSQIAPNFVLILWISQPCPNRGYSQCIYNLSNFVLLANICNFTVKEATATCSGFIELSKLSINSDPSFTSCPILVP
jgi:hypothetical protein